MTAPPFDRLGSVTVGDIAIAHAEAGGGGGRPLVLIHGFACGMRMWKGVMRHLARDRRVIVYDQRGHGRSGAPDDPAAYSASHLARDFTGFLDALGLERVDVVGFSMGGGPALGLALAQPARIGRLVLADVGSGAENPWGLVRLAEAWVDHAARGGWDELAPDMLRGEFFKQLARRGPASRRYMDALLRQHPLHGIVHTLTQVLARRKPLFRMTGRLAAVRAPTLVLTGANDFVCLKAAKLLHRSIRGAQAVQIEGGSHMVPVEKPAEFARVVRDFIAG
ncbi:MAG: 3-oxoadipate enol-lactonase [Thalassobaculales bacterium]